VLWLVGEDHELSEVGTMNLFVFWINEKVPLLTVSAVCDELRVCMTGRA
jgi:hypothetical protein